MCDTHVRVALNGHGDGLIHSPTRHCLAWGTRSLAGYNAWRIRALVYR